MDEKAVCAHDYFVWCGAKKKNKKKTNKIRQFSGTYISETTGAISLKFDIQSHVYAPTKIYKFDRNRPNSFRAMIG